MSKSNNAWWAWIDWILARSGVRPSFFGNSRNLLILNHMKNLSDLGCSAHVRRKRKNEGLTPA
jgi:hypothetical protein